MDALTESLVGHKTTGWMTQFKPSEWEKLSPDERLGLLQEAENRIAAEEKRMARTIVPQKMEGKNKRCNGYYNPNDHTKIFINENLINDTSGDDAENGPDLPGYTACTALKAVYHEGRHAFQDDCAKGRSAVINGKMQADRLLKDVAKEEGRLDDNTLKLWKMQQRVYFTDEDEEKGLPDAYLRYYFQPNEDDAEDFAIQKIHEIAEQLDDFDFSVCRNYHQLRKKGKEQEAERLWNRSDFRDQIAQEVRNRYNRIGNVVASVQAIHRASAPAGKTAVTPAFNPEKRKFSPIQYAILGGTLLWLLLLYWIAAPSGLLQHLLWFVSAAIPFVPVVMLLRAFPYLRNKKGGILLLALFAILLLLIQKLYFWLSIAYLVVGTIALFKGITNILPDTYTVTLEDADGATTTETHILGNNPEQDIKTIDSGYISQGYTKK